MMKTKIILAAILGLSAMASASLRSDIETMNKAVAKTMMKKDIEGFKKAVKGVVTSDFKYMEKGKAMSFDEMVAQMKQGFAQMGKMISVKSTTKNLKEKGNTGSCTTIHTVEMTMVGEDKKSHKMVMIGTSIDSFRKEKGKWKMSSMDWKDEKMTMDGKPMDMSQMGGGK